MNLVIYTGATDKTRAAVTSVTDTTPVSSLEQLMLGDSAPLTITFTDGSAVPSWVGTDGYVVSVGLGAPDGDGNASYTSTTNFTYATSTYTGRLSLGTQRLIDALKLVVGSAVDWSRFPTQARVPGPRPVYGYFYLQVIVTDTDGNPVTYANLRVPVLNRVLPNNAGDTPVEYATYEDVVAAQEAAEESAIEAAASAAEAAASAGIDANDFALTSGRALNPLPEMATVLPISSLATSTTIASSTHWRGNNAAFTILRAHVSLVGSTFPDDSFYARDNVTSANTVSELAVEFAFDGSEIELYTKGTGCSYRWLVDGRYATPLLTLASNGTPYYNKLTFPDRRRRIIRIEGGGGSGTFAGGWYFGGCFVGPKDVISITPRDIGPRLISIGDSHDEPTGATYGALGIAAVFGHIIGADVWQSGSGGTGFTTNGSITGRYTYYNRIESDVTARSPRMVMVFGSPNDITNYQATGGPALYDAAVRRLLAKIRADLPSLNELIVTGITPSSGLNGSSTRLASALEMNTILAAACVTYGATFLNITNRLTGTGNTSVATTTGNANYWSGGDDAHFSPAGNVWYGTELAEAYLQSHAAGHRPIDLTRMERLAGVYQYNADPESAVTGSPGQLLSRTDTGAAYVKATGTGSTGWSALLPAAGATSITTLGTIATGTWAASVIGGGVGGTGVANTGKTITVGGNFATSGAFATTLTVTGATNVTLPTTGTLATLAGSETFANKTLASPTMTTVTVTSGGLYLGDSTGNGTVDLIIRQYGDVAGNTSRGIRWQSTKNSGVGFLDRQVIYMKNGQNSPDNGQGGDLSFDYQIATGGLVTWATHTRLTNTFTLSSNLQVGSAGVSISRIRRGTATLVAGTVTVSDTNVTANSEIYVGIKTPGGTVGAHFVSVKTAATSFVITSTSGTDTSVVSYWMVEP